MHWKRNRQNPNKLMLISLEIRKIILCYLWYTFCRTKNGLFLGSKAKLKESKHGSEDISNIIIFSWKLYKNLNDYRKLEYWNIEQKFLEHNCVILEKKICLDSLLHFQSKNCIYLNLCWFRFSHYLCLY